MGFKEEREKGKGSSKIGEEKMLSPSSMFTF